jgi:hypothetical protein
MRERSNVDAVETVPNICRESELNWQVDVNECDSNPVILRSVIQYYDQNIHGICYQYPNEKVLYHPVL